MNAKKKTKEINTNPVDIENLLNRGTEDVLVRESLEKKLQSGKPLRIKLGVDPTSAHIHIGRAVVLRKLRAFQDMGHKAVFIVGDFTAKIGDPSDKLSKRPMLTDEDIVKNLKNYKEQVGSIINLDEAEFHYNSEWLSKLTFKEIAELSESFSVAQMLSRRNFKDRIESGDDISLREFLYPLMQGYDSVAISADVELGGFDQLFNLKAGRVIQKHYGRLEQDILTSQMLEGTDGRKMSSSWGNIIAITDGPGDMYGKVMSLRDELLEKYFLLTTDVSVDEIKQLSEEAKTNPKEIKMRLAREIVAIYHNEEKAVSAEKNWEEAFSKGGVPEGVEEVEATPETKIADVLLSKKVVASKSELRRLVESGAVTHTDSGEKVLDINKVAKIGIYKIGKRRFIKIVVKKQK